MKETLATSDQRTQSIINKGIDTHLRSFAKNKLPKVDKNEISILPLTTVAGIKATKHQAKKWSKGQASP